MYNGSERHLENLKKARMCAVNSVVDCDICGKSFTKAGIRNHRISCSKRKTCPVCNIFFKGKSVTCSHSCANTYFRTGPNHGNWKYDSYRTTCFYFHKKECVICKESNIVEVHHLDENHNNNEPSNLIPMCPTHHQYWHSEYKYLVEDKVKEYIRVWENGNLAHLE